MSDVKRPDSPQSGGQLDRRALLVGVGAAAVGAIAYPMIRRLIEPSASVFLAGNQKYDGPIDRTIRDGLIATGFDPATIKGRRVLLKPNLVEPTRAAPQMTTNPAIVRAVTEVFRRWDAEVVVGEAPGHVRDTEMAVFESGLGTALADDKIRFADLNYEDSRFTKNLGRTCDLEGFHFPRSILEADLIVSLPKLKTHHWVGITCALKNLYGTLPGIMYGWPKNVLHHAGIPQTVVDINASLPPTVTVVDAIECMEGDGPILGTPKHLGMLAIGTNLCAVDATCARIMGLDPARVSYLEIARGMLGPVSERFISERGEPWQSLASPFTMPDFPHLTALRSGSSDVLMS